MEVEQIMEILIKNSRIVDASQDFIGDVYIKDGIIAQIGKNINIACNTINGEGLTLLPSFIDTHVHFRDPGFEYKEDILSGSKAAVKGGFTGVNLMANTRPVCSTMETVNYVMQKASEIGLVDVHQCVSITRAFEGTDISHLDSLYYPVKMISEDGYDVSDSKVMLNAMQKAKDKELTVMCHCDDDRLVNIDSRLSENVMTWRNIELAKFAGNNIHIAHVSTKEAMQYIIDAKKQHFNVTCEVTPHHIALTDEVKYRVNPSLRKDEDVNFLINAIKEGYVDTIGTDHAPHTEEDKAKGAPGMTGIEIAFPICYTKLVKEGHITLNKLSEIMSKNPAMLLEFNKGSISIGFEGDFVLVDLNKKFKVDSSSFQSKGKNTPFNGMELYGDVKITLKKGNIVYNKDIE